ncbi:hypothetical protein ABGB09_06885 [Streptomyces sp. B8F3]|uniref:hypothetical protein n=1 Tax=Streptomyces sp. B8F3 TaxID=3153573 RepID=UPI00325F8747
MPSSLRRNSPVAESTGWIDTACALVTPICMVCLPRQLRRSAGLIIGCIAPPSCLRHSASLPPHWITSYPQVPEKVLRIDRDLGNGLAHLLLAGTFFTLTR